MIVDITIPRHLFVFGQSRAKVSALVIALLVLDRTLNTTKYRKK